MELDNKYYVLKRSDVQRLDPKAIAQLERIVGAHAFVRELRGVDPLKTVVVEHDWPEYEAVVSSILRRAAAAAYQPSFAGCMLLVATVIGAALIVVELVLK